MKNIQSYGLIIDGTTFNFYTCESLEKIQIGVEHDGKQQELFFSYHQTKKPAKFLLSILPDNKVNFVGFSTYFISFRTETITYIY